MNKVGGMLWRVTPLFPGLIPIIAAFFVAEPGVLFKLGFFLLGVGVFVTAYRVVQTINGLAPEGESS